MDTKIERSKNDAPKAAARGLYGDIDHSDLQVQRCSFEFSEPATDKN